MAIKEITPKELDSLTPGRFLLIDAREKAEYDYGAVPGCVYFSPEQLESMAEQNDPALPKDRLLVLYSSRDASSLALAAGLKERGFETCVLTGGYSAWALYSVQKRVNSAENSDSALPAASEIEKSIQKRFHGRLMGPFARAILKYNMIQEGDRIAVCISGGKDSMLMAKLFQEFQKHGHVPFELRFIVMDPGYNSNNRAMIENNLRLLGIPAEVFETRIFDAVYTIENSPCYLCARMRRGYLYRKAADLGCNKIALGHHYDDVIETALMGMLYSGQWSAMMPKLWSTNFPGMELIRPMYFIREEDIRLWRDANRLYFLQCACRFTEETAYADKEKGAHSLSKRQETKQLIAQLKKTNPQIETNIFHATENVTIDKLLGYKKNGRRHSFLDTYSEQDGSAEA